MTYQVGEKVVHIPTGKVYDFGYLSATPAMAVVYEEGECNGQDASAVFLIDLKPEKKRTRIMDIKDAILRTEQRISMINGDLKFIHTFDSSPTQRELDLAQEECLIRERDVLQTLVAYIRQAPISPCA